MGTKRKQKRSGVSEPRYDYDVFIVYADADASFVRDDLLPELHLPDDRVLLVERLELGAPLVSEIERGVARSRFTLVVLSPDYLRDRWAVFGEQLFQDIFSALDLGRIVLSFDG